jgi:PAS domain S-box-containing protein
MHKAKSGAVAQGMVHLGMLLRERRGEIVDRWLKAVRLGRRGRTMTAPALIDHIPPLLDDIATLADEVAHRGASNLPDHDAAAHARHRLEAGFDLETVIHEYGDLRKAILELLDSEARVLYPGELTLLNRALDVAVGQAVSAWTTEQQRVLRALDRVSEAALSTTDPEDAQQMVLRSEARNAAMLEVALDCIISMDAHGVVTTWNPAAERTFGFSAREAVGHELADLIIPPELRDAHRAGLVRYLSTGQERVFNRRIEMPAVRRDGTRVIVELAITRIPVDGPPLFTGFLRDITERMQTQDEQKRLFAEAQEVTRARETLLAIVSHDLRNPLAAIMAGAGLLLRKSSEGGDDTTRRSLETVLRAASKMDRLIADLLDTASIQTGRLSMDRRLQPLAPIVADAQHLHHPLAVEKGIRWTFEIELIDVECFCDRGRILQVLSNLLLNALRFCQSGDSIQVWATAMDTQAIIEIADTGPGISPQHLPHIFEPYWSGGQGANQSTGLGLFISKGIVEAHGGQLWADSGPGRGTTFRFTLPVTMGEQES